MTKPMPRFSGPGPKTPNPDTKGPDITGPPENLTPMDSKVPNPQPPNSQPMIRLDDFMKAAGMVGTGGEAKVRIQSGEVLVNDEVETRRRRQLHTGDEVNWDSQVWLVELTDDEESGDQA